MAKTIFDKNYRGTTKRKELITQHLRKKYVDFSSDSDEENDANTSKNIEESPVVLDHPLFDVDKSCNSLQIKHKQHPQQSNTDVQKKIVDEPKTDDSSLEALEAAINKPKLRNKPKKFLFGRYNGVLDGSLQVKEKESKDHPLFDVDNSCNSLQIKHKQHPQQSNTDVQKKIADEPKTDDGSLEALEEAINKPKLRNKPKKFLFGRYNGVLDGSLQIKEKESKRRPPTSTPLHPNITVRKSNNLTLSPINVSPLHTSTNDERSRSKTPVVVIPPLDLDQQTELPREKKELPQCSKDLFNNKAAEQKGNCSELKRKARRTSNKSTNTTWQHTSIKLSPRTLKQVVNRKKKSLELCITKITERVPKDNIYKELLEFCHYVYLDKVDFSQHPCFKRIYNTEDKRLNCSKSTNTSRQLRSRKSESDTQTSLHEAVNNSSSKQAKTHDVEISIDLRATPNKSIVSEVANKSSARGKEITEEPPQRSLSTSRSQAQDSSTPEKNASFVERRERSVRSSPKKTSDDDHCNFQSPQRSNNVDAIACTPSRNSSLAASSSKQKSPRERLHVPNRESNDSGVQDSRTPRRLFSPGTEKSPKKAKLTTTSKENSFSKVTLSNDKSMLVESNKKLEKITDSPGRENTKLNTPNKEINNSKIIPDADALLVNGSQNNAIVKLSRKSGKSTDSLIRENTKNQQNKSYHSISSLEKSTPRNIKLTTPNKEKSVQHTNSKIIPDVHVVSVNDTGQHSAAEEANGTSEKCTDSSTRRSKRSRQKKSKLSLTPAKENTLKKAKLSTENKESSWQHDRIINVTHGASSNDVSQSDHAGKPNDASTGSSTKTNTRIQRSRSRLSSTSVKGNIPKKVKLNTDAPSLENVSKNNAAVESKDTSPKSTPTHGTTDKKIQSKCDSPVFKKPTARPKRTKKPTDNKEIDQSEQSLRRSERERKPRKVVPQEIIITSSKDIIRHFNDAWYWGKANTAKPRSKNTSQKSNKRSTQKTSFVSNETENDKNLNQDSQKRLSSLTLITESESHEQNSEEFQEARYNSPDSGMQSNGPSCSSWGQNKNVVSLNKSLSRSLHVQNFSNTKENKQKRVAMPSKLKPTKEDKNLLFSSYVDAKKYNLNSGYLEIKTGGCKHLRQVPKGDVVYIVLEGSGEIEINGEVEEVMPTSLFVVEKNDYYMIRNTSDVHRLLLYFSKRDSKNRR